LKRETAQKNWDYLGKGRKKKCWENGDVPHHPQRELGGGGGGGGGGGTKGKSIRARMQTKKK